MNSAGGMNGGGDGSSGGSGGDGRRSGNISGRSGRFTAGGGRKNRISPTRRGSATKADAGRSRVRIFVCDPLVEILDV